MERIRIVVLDDGDTYGVGGFIVYVTEEELERIEDGERVCDVVDLDNSLHSKKITDNMCANVKE